MSLVTPDITKPRGDTVDVQVQWPGADLTGGIIRATLKQNLDDADNDDAAIWKADLQPSDPSVCDDPTTGIANVRVPPGAESIPGTYNAQPDQIAYLDIEATLADPTSRFSHLVIIKFSKDGTRRTS
jgi:hypothetical protein